MSKLIKISDDNHKILKKLSKEERRSIKTIVDRALRNLFKSKKILPLIIALLLIPSCNIAYAYTDREAVRAIIGEASNQDEIGMWAVASAIINRGTLKGVYGLKSPHIDKEPTWVWKMAERAYNRAKDGDLVHSGTHWENINAFGEPYWVKGMIKVYEHKDHVFYRERSK